MKKEYKLPISKIGQMFCPDEGILAKFSDTSELSISEWLEEKGFKPISKREELIEALGYGWREAENQYLDSQYKDSSLKDIMYNIQKECKLSEEETKDLEDLCNGMGV